MYIKYEVFAIRFSQIDSIGVIFPQNKIDVVFPKIEIKTISVLYGMNKEQKTSMHQITDKQTNKQLNCTPEHLAHKHTLFFI